MDILSIEHLKIETTIGVLDWERQIKQMLCFDLQWVIDAAKVAKTDNIADAGDDYAAVSKALQTFVEEHHFFLIETLAEKLAEFLLSAFTFGGLKLKVSKPGAISNAQNVAVTIERGVNRFNRGSNNGDDH